MSPKLLTLALSFGIIVTCGALLAAHYLAENRRAAAHAFGTSEGRLKTLSSFISAMADDRPELFRQFVGSGLETNATSLPLAILTNTVVPFTVDNFRENLVDAWGHPLLVKIKLVKVSGNTEVFTMTVRSNGPNGVNENGAADDLSFSSTVQCGHVPGAGHE